MCDVLVLASLDVTDNCLVDGREEAISLIHKAHILNTQSRIRNLSYRYNYTDLKYI